jgi:DNA-binding IclR family transcriptional regulator
MTAPKIVRPEGGDPADHSIPTRRPLRARVSTRNGQTPENQIRALCEVASRKGWEIVDEYVDHGVSGAKGGAPQDDATPHAAQNISGRASRIARRTVRHPGCLVSQRARALPD